MSAGTPSMAPQTVVRRRLARLDRFDLGVLGALFLLSIVVLLALLLRVWIRGGLVTGSDNYIVIDQLQYLDWLRQAGDHWLIGDLYDTRPGARVFLHPGALVSGLLHRAGLGVVAAYAIWKPVAVVAIFAGAVAYVRRFFARTDDRRLALVLGLFALSPVAAAVAWLGEAGFGDAHTRLRLDFLTGELWPGTYLWGYPFTAIAVGLLPLALLAYERGRAEGAKRMLWAAAACGLLCAWLQPWQGATLALVIVAAELVSLRRERRQLAAVVRDAAAPLAAIAVPLVYYLVLSRTDAAWKLADKANDIGRWPWWVTVVVLAPFAVPALFAYRLPAPTFGAVALRAWPLAGLAMFYQPAGTFPAHAFQGLTLPLVVLGVLALRHRLGGRSVPLAGGVAVAALMILPGLAHRANDLHGGVKLALQPYFLTPGEHDALAYLSRSPEPGGVLAPQYTGQTVPAYTGRATWVGALSWTPDYYARVDRANRLFDGRLSPAQAKDLVRASGARFLLSDCHRRARIGRTVAGFTDRVYRFGCATIYRVRR